MAGLFYKIFPVGTDETLDLAIEFSEFILISILVDAGLNMII